MTGTTSAHLTYEQAQRALDQQERLVYELRQRTGPLLTAAALIASFFGAAALDREGLAIPVVLAGVALTVTVLGGLYVLFPHRLEFSVDARQMHADMTSGAGGDDALLVRVAFALADTRTRNEHAVALLARCLAISAGALVAQIVCWAWALAIL